MAIGKMTVHIVFPKPSPGQLNSDAVRYLRREYPNTIFSSALGPELRKRIKQRDKGYFHFLWLKW